MSNPWVKDTAAKLGTFRVARDPNPAPPAVKAAIARATKKADRETAAIKAKRRPSRTVSR
jgi:hypothetical protein